ncbi:MAG: LPXTG cell wall anchor domain-containing protein, partial [Ruminococcus sp.]|nr:LPXTG cell wall anchor domain-containing protein [Ruminococcus sp.]
GKNEQSAGTGVAGVGMAVAGIALAATAAVVSRKRK